MDNKITGTIFDIQSFSLHDGPGIRTTVFLKGCNNRCVWCHNPESYAMKPQLRFYSQACKGCKACIGVCTHGALKENNFDPTLCVACGDCVKACLYGAREICGKQMTVADVLKRIVQDKPFYAESDGGLTLSGGEPLLQPDFCEALLYCTKREGIGCGIQTAGNIPYETISRVIPYLDFVMLDIKLIDREKHKRYIGTDNSLILQNAERLAKEKPKLFIRTPVLNGINDDELEAVHTFVQSLGGGVTYTLLPYHSYGEGKKDSLFMEKGTVFSAPDNFSELKSKYEIL